MNISSYYHRGYSPSIEEVTAMKVYFTGNKVSVQHITAQNET